MSIPNEGIELLYTRDCQAWPDAKDNLLAALEHLNMKTKITEVVIDTMDQAYIYNFFASPTIHINGQDVDPMGRRTGKRGMGKDRPYFYDKRSWPAPSVDMIIKALQELY